MGAKRIIPCLDVKDGRVVKGVHFVELRDAGDPVELATVYNQAGADELIFLDISASTEGRVAMIEVVRQTAAVLSIPLTVGGGISKMEHIEAVLQAGADKVGISTAAVQNPQLIAEGAKIYGSHKIVVAIDAKYNEQWEDWEVYTHGGRTSTGIHALEWAEEVQRLGAGEILLNSMEADGTKDGFDVALTRAVSERVSIPVIASGGAGKNEHFYQILTSGKADAALAASVFHYQEMTIANVKDYLKRKGVEVK